MPYGCRCGSLAYRALLVHRGQDKCFRIHRHARGIRGTKLCVHGHVEIRDECVVVASEAREVEAAVSADASESWFAAIHSRGSELVGYESQEQK